MKKYNSLPKSWVKILVDSVFKNPEAGNEYINNSYNKTEIKIVVTLPDKSVWKLKNAHDGSLYFKSINYYKTIRVSTHWRTNSTRKVSQYSGYSCIPEIHGKVETYRGFAAMIY